MALQQRHCVPCEGTEKPMGRDEAARMLREVPGWTIIGDGGAIEREFKRKDFADALALVDGVGEVAEEEGHHPDILLHGYKLVRFTLATHAIGGLSENDFILAAKIDELAG